MVEFSNNSNAFYRVHSGKLRKKWKNGPFEDVFPFSIENETYSIAMLVYQRVQLFNGKDHSASHS